MAANNTAVNKNTFTPQPNNWSVVTSLFSAAIITTNKHGRSTTPILPDMAVAANANWRRAPARRSSL